MATKAVIFDCWNTLFYVQAQPTLFDRLSKSVIRRGGGYGLMKRVERSLMAAQEPDSEVAARKLLIDLKLPVSPFLVRRVVKILNQPQSEGKPYHNTLAILQELSRDYKLGMITNTFEVAFRSIRSQYQLDTQFDVVTTSYETGLLKPDPAIFTLTLERLGVRAEEAVMVGDSLKDDVRAAEQAGIPAILVDRSRRADRHARRIHDLTELPSALSRG